MNELLEKLRAALAADYAVERELGSGGMAIVYLAHDIKHERDVAVKVLRPELAASLGVERFLREIKIAAKLSHPHILPLYDSGAADGFLYYVMPFVEGESLGDLLQREKQLSIDEAVRIAREVAEALAQAHSYGIMHRDIKPDNVMISGGHAVVSDFGIARAFSAAGGDNLTQTGMAVGTPAYMSPEQAAGDPSVDARADVYSLGCMLYEMLVGQIPFTGPNAQAIMARHTMDTITPPQIMRQSIPDELQDIIICAMEKTPADRFRTAGEFADALKALESGTVPAVRKSTLLRARQAKQPARWRKFALPVAAAVAVVVVGFSGWQLVGNKPASAATDGLFDPRRVAVLYFQDLSPGGELQHVADGLTEGLIDNLSQVRSLDVISHNGVVPYRRGLVSSDSIAQVLRTGSVIAGTVNQEGDRVRVTAQLIEGTSGTDFARTSFEVPAQELLAARDSIAEAVSRLLRQRLGEEIQLRQRRAGTGSVEAWALVQRAEKLTKDAERQLRTEGVDQTVRTALQADSVLALAQQADPNWIEPLLLRGHLAYRLARLAHATHEGADHSEDMQWLTAGLAQVDRALQLAPRDPHALGLRGSLRHFEWQLDVVPDPAEQALLLDSAQADLEAAVAADPTLAEAHYELSVLHYARKDNFSALMEARAAYQEDAYLGMADDILYRLFFTHYDLEQFTDATHWCDEGSRRFAGDARFVECQLWLLIAPGSAADVAHAWELWRQLDTMLTGPSREFSSHLGRMIVGGVIARAGDRDSADAVLLSARAGRDIDPEQELMGYEAVMRILQGDRDQAVELLKRYVAINPGHSFDVNGDLMWWWRPLRDHPGFSAVAAPR